MDPSPSGTSTSAPPTTMPIRPPRTLVLCFDGTSNEYSTANTNVIKFVSLLSKDEEKQLVYYQAGVGTYFQPGFVSPLFSWGAKMLDEAVAFYLPEHVMQGYKFLMQNYIVGDRVCLFGFSRGAYTARALAGMLHKVGLLSRDNDEQIPFAYSVYKSDRPKDAELAAGFKEAFGREVPIEFVGVWDTVASVGIVSMRSLPFVQTNTTIRTFRQALSLDEHRAKFRPSHYNRPGVAKQAPSWLDKLRNKLFSRRSFSGHASLASKDPLQTPPTSHKSQSPERFDMVTDAKELWFAGCHTDVGGGSEANNAEFALGNITLRWMIREVIKSQCGVVFDDAAFVRLGFPRQLLNIFDEKTPDETRDHQDALQPIHDQLKAQPLWWLLEIVPTNFTYQSVVTNQWVSKWSIHLGRGRFVPPDAQFHESVKFRMDDSSLKYTPRARYKQSNITFVA